MVLSIRYLLQNKQRLMCSLFIVNNAMLMLEF